MERLPPVYGQQRRVNLVDTHEPLLASARAGKLQFHAVGRSHYPGKRLQSGQMSGLLTAGFWDAQGDQDWGMDLHRNEGMEICLLETGRMGFAVDGATCQLRPGDLTITRPWQAHRQGDPQVAAGRLHWVTIDVRAMRPDQDWLWPDWVLLAEDDSAELTRRLRSTGTNVWRANREVVRSFRKLALAVAGDDPSLVSRLGVELNVLLLSILDLLRTENPAELPGLGTREHSVELFLSDLQSNLNALEQPWTLGSMARACGMGTTLFSRLCRILTNESPVRFLSRARLQAAARLLRTHPERSVLSVALECGYQSSQYFAYDFRRRFGVTPSEFRAGGASG